MLGSNITTVLEARLQALESKIQALESHVKAQFEALRAEVIALRSEIRLMHWLFGVVITMLLVLIALALEARSSQG